MKKLYKGPERRQFIRLEHSAPLALKVCKEKTISNLLEGYTADISQAGLLCNVNEKVDKGDILWLSFDRSTLSICEEMEKRSFIYQNGVIGKVARVEKKDNGSYDVGVQFITREEKNLTNIYPKIHFLEQGYALSDDEEAEEELEAPQPQEEKQEEKVEA